MDKLQLNPTIPDVKGPTSYIHYRWISIIANIEIKRNLHERIKFLSPLLADFRYSWIRYSGV